MKFNKKLFKQIQIKEEKTWKILRKFEAEKGFYHELTKRVRHQWCLLHNILQLLEDDE